MEVSEACHRRPQASRPDVELGLSRAGVQGVAKAIRLRWGSLEQLVSAEIDCTVDLAASQKGVHMSRFPELFEEAIERVVIGEALLVEALAEHIAQHDRRAAARAARRGANRRAATRSSGGRPSPASQRRRWSRWSESPPPGDAEPARRRRRGDGDQRVPVRSGPRARQRRPSGSTRPASTTATSSESSSSSRSRRTTSAAAERSTSEPRRS